MIKKYVLLILMLLSGHVAAETAHYRVLSVVTQDKNGLNMVTVVANAKAVTASVLIFPTNESTRKPPSSYPRERFDEIWDKTQQLDLEKYIASEDTKDLSPATNYLLTIGFGDSLETVSKKIYMIPKCGAPQELIDLVTKLANDLLPKGSPGLFYDCKVNQ
jgi:hypothetical protein